MTIYLQHMSARKVGIELLYCVLCFHSNFEQDMRLYNNATFEPNRWLSDRVSKSH